MARIQKLTASLFTRCTPDLRRRVIAYAEGREIGDGVAIRQLIALGLDYAEMERQQRQAAIAQIVAGDVPVARPTPPPAPPTVPRRRGLAAVADPEPPLPGQLAIDGDGAGGAR